MPKPSGSGRGHRGRGRRQPAPPITSEQELRSWFTGSIPDDWFTSPIEIVFDRDEIVVRGELATPTLNDGDDMSIAATARIGSFRESTRDQRISVAQQAEDRFKRRVSWEATCADEVGSFTRASTPVMTRLHLEDRQTLDTLIDAGIARSRSEAMAWCVRLVAENEAAWLGEIREAMTDLEALRDQGPASRQES